MANDITAYSAGLQVEITTSSAELRALSAGVQVELDPATSAGLKAQSVGLQVDVRAREVPGLTAQAVGLQVEVFAISTGDITAYSVGLQVEYVPGEGVVDDSGPPIDDDDIIDDPLTSLPLFISQRIFDVRFIDISQSFFANPDEGYTGYAADGFYYSNGVLQPTFSQFKASWAVEGEGAATSTRSNVDRFPDRIYVVTTLREVAILDADTGSLWMRFSQNTGFSGSKGHLAGDVTTELRGADFSEGYLCIATGDGLRIADFRNDRGFRLGGEAATQSAALSGLVNRNTDGYVTGQTITGNNLLVGSDCTSVSMCRRGEVVSGSKNSLVLAAVGHIGGLTGVRLVFPGQSEPETLEHDFAKAYSTNWEILDDNDGDGTSPTFTDDVPSDWLGGGIRPGDIIVTGFSDQYTVLEVGPTSLTLASEEPVGTLGFGYSITRPVRRVEALPGGTLYFANGDAAVTVIDSEAWYDGSPLDAFSGSLKTITLPSTGGGAINDIAVSGGARYVATDVGVYYAEAADFNDSAVVELRYSQKDQTSPAATYAILEGTLTAATAIGVDPETGSLLIALSNKVDASVLTEVDPSLQRAFRFFTRSEFVTSIAGYRNPGGPQDTESS